ncbi:MAG: nucleotide exchange factor GrpE [Bacillota bacterium]|nr:nucleotide exchange factor GrpE [Bacillota bacterium]
MDDYLQDINSQLEDIDSKLLGVYTTLSHQKSSLKNSIKGKSLWEEIFPGVLIMKNIELLNQRLDEILKLTSSLSSFDRPEAESLTAAPSVSEPKTAAEPEAGQETSPAKLKAEGLDPLILDIIRLRDQLLIARYNCDENQQRILTSLYEELGRILRVNGVESLESEKIFNKQYHAVVEVKKTDRPELNNTIADTCRPGYRYKGEVIRAQEVILYRYVK